MVDVLSYPLYRTPAGSDADAHGPPGVGTIRTPRDECRRWRGRIGARPARLGQLLRRPRRAAVDRPSVLARRGPRRRREPRDRDQRRLLVGPLRAEPVRPGTYRQAERVAIHHRRRGTARFHRRGGRKPDRRVDSHRHAAAGALGPVEAGAARFELAARARTPGARRVGRERPRGTYPAGAAGAGRLCRPRPDGRSGERDPLAQAPRAARREGLLLGAQERVAALVHAHGRRRPGPGHRVRECRQPSARARDEPAEGDRRAAGSGRQPRAADPPAADRRRRARVCRWRGGTAAGRVGQQSPVAARLARRPQSGSVRRGRRTEPGHPGLHGRGLRADHHLLRGWCRRSVRRPSSCRRR